MHPSPTSCANVSLQSCRIGARCARWCVIGAARVCSTVRSALPGHFATDVAANHAVPGAAKSSALCTDVALARAGEAVRA
jgi:hypothetical protein